MNELKVTLVQVNLTWEDATANIEHLRQVLASVTDTDVIVLPEMFATGFSMNASTLAADSYQQSIAFMQQIASSKNVAICGSLICVDEGKYYNRFIWMSPDGAIFFYNKRHLFTMGDEGKHYTQGKDLLTIEYRGWRIRPFICYDLRFPIWSRNNAKQPYDLLLYVANWPQKRIVQWQKLLQARAIENSAYVIGVNRIGVDGNGYNYTGMSASVDFMGEAFVLEESKEMIHTVTLFKEPMLQFRTSFPVLNDADAFEIL